ncbi:MAG TPA: gluconate 2-dehydrogenase subunit 3 family protein [Opitutus sp.]|nr:gluconate 2-dehydrogenase subunit 3 family protein [Opitutus sp.]
MNSRDLPRMDRRTAIRWMLTAASSAMLFDPAAWSADGVAAAPVAPSAGYGSDPDLMKDYRPGDLWPLTFTEQQRRAAIALCDTIIPADEHSPSASAVGVPDFFDEWVSAPYPGQIRDRAVILDGLAWLDAEARRRFQNDFADLTEARKTALCDDLKLLSAAKPEHQEAARFFARFRDLTVGAFYTTKEGMKDLGYVGNVPLPRFDGPPPEALRRIGLA